MIFQNTAHPFDFYENLLTSGEPNNIYSIVESNLTLLKEDLAERSLWFEKINKSLEALGFVPNNTQNSDEYYIINSTYMQCWRQLCDEYGAEIFQPMNMLTYDIFGRTVMNSIPGYADKIPELEKIGKMAAEDLNQKISKNWSEYIPELKRTIASCFLTGGAVLKVFMDPRLNRPTIKLIEAEKIVIDPNASSLETAERITHIFEMNDRELQDYIRLGIFADSTIPTMDSMDTNGNIQQTRDQIAGVQTRSLGNSRQNYKLAEEITYQFPEDMGDAYGMHIARDRQLPYKITFDFETGTPLRVQRSWYQNKDDIVVKLDLVKFTYLQSLNFWGLGLVDTLMPLHDMASIIETELNKSIRFTNMPTGIMGSQITNETNQIVIKPGVINQINTDDGTLESVRPVPFPPVSPLFPEYLKTVENKMRETTAISQIKVESLPANIKGSVLLALLDKEYKNMSAVMRQMIGSLNNLFSIIKEIYADELGDGIFMDKSFQLSNKDVYGQKIEIMSTADPNYSNSSLQVTLFQTIFEFAGQHPELHKMRELYQRFYEVLRLDNIDSILLTEEEYKAQQAQAQEAQAQQAQAQRAQAQAQAQAQQAQLDLQKQQSDTQNKIMMSELMLKEKQQDMKNELEKLKLQTESSISAKRLEIEQLKEIGENTKQINIEKSSMFKTFLDYFINKTEIERKFNISMPDFVPPKLEEYDEILEQIRQNSETNLHLISTPSLDEIVPQDDGSPPVEEYTDELSY